MYICLAADPHLNESIDRWAAFFLNPIIPQSYICYKEIYMYIYMSILTPTSPPSLMHN